MNDLEDQADDLGTSNRVLVQRLDHVLVVTINRIERRNAIDGVTAAELFDAFARFEAEDDLFVAILTGAGGTFCAGADLKGIGEGVGNRVSSNMKEPGPLGCTRMQLSKPVIAAVEGFAVAGGLELATWSDLRVVAKDATFGVYCRRWGVPLVDGGTVRLPRLIGQSRALDMILTGRGIGGEEALSWGLANRVCESGEALHVALQLASELSRLPQACLRSDRRSAYEQWGLDLPGALANEVRHGLLPIRAGETQEGAKRFAAGAGRHGQRS